MIGETEIETTTEAAIEDVLDLPDTEIRDVASLTWTRTPLAVTIERVNVKTATVEKVHETIEHGIGIGEREVAEVTEKTEGCQDVMLDVTTMTARRGGTEIFLKVAWIEDQVPAAGEDHQEAIVMNSQCKWEAETGRRAPVLHQRRKSLHRI